MASPSDINTTTFVGKYLSRQTTATRINADANTASENQAVLESIAIALMLNPQAVLSIILRTKNSLQQLVAADLELIDYITAAIAETQNPDLLVASTTDLVDAQTALVELDRIGRISTNLQSYARYNSAIQNFLNKQLAPQLKRSQNGTLNRSGLEAKQDLFNAVQLFVQTHQLFVQRLAQLAVAITDFTSVDLSRVAHTQTVARVRTSLDQIKAGMDQGSMSQTVAALELLAGSASLQSIANTGSPYDPTLQSSLIPAGNTYVVGPEPTSAFETTQSPGPVTTVASSWVLSLSTDGNATVNAEMPKSGKSLCPFVVSQRLLPGPGTVTVPVGVKLYVDVVPGPSPGVDGVTHFAIPLTSGVRTNAQLIADINAVWTGGASDFDTAIGSIILVATNTDTSVRVLSNGPGTFAGSVFTPDAPSAHVLLGFAPNQVSSAIGTFDFAFLALFFKAMFPTVATQVLGSGAGAFQVTSLSTVPNISSLAFSGHAAHDFGFLTGPAAGYAAVTVKAVPLALLITNATSAVQDPAGLGVLVGSLVATPTFRQTITGLDGSRLLFGVNLPLVASSVTVMAPTVVAVQALMTLLGAANGTFDGDILPLQGKLSPLLSTPSLAQVSDALKAFTNIRSRESSLLSSMVAIVVAENQQPADVTASAILQSLEEHGLDKAFELLSQSQFSSFFALTSETVSKSTTFMKNMETAVSTDFPTSTVEEDMPDGNLLAGSNDSSSVLTDKEVP